MDECRMRIMVFWKVRMAMSRSSYSCSTAIMKIMPTLAPALKSAPSL